MSDKACAPTGHRGGEGGLEVPANRAADTERPKRRLFPPWSGAKATPPLHQSGGLDALLEVCVRDPCVRAVVSGPGVAVAWSMAGKMHCGRNDATSKKRRGIAQTGLCFVEHDAEHEDIKSNGHTSRAMDTLTSHRVPGALLCARGGQQGHATRAHIMLHSRRRLNPAHRARGVPDPSHIGGAKDLAWGE